MNCGILNKHSRILANNFMKNKHILSIITLLIAFVGLISCGDQQDSFQIISPAMGARVKFIHAAPDVPGIDIYVNDKKFSGVNTSPPAVPTLLTYGGSYPSTAEYATLSAGKAKVAVVVPSLNVTGITADLTVEEGKYYSVFATGITPTYTPLVLEDKLPVASGKTIFVRVINLIPNSTTADFTVNGNVIASGVAFKNTDNTFYSVPIDAFTTGTINVPFTIKVLGGVATVNIATVSQTAVIPGKIYTVIARGVVTTDAKNPTKFAPSTTIYVNR
jgi:hypothetical protein